MAIMLIVDGYSLGVALALRIAPGLGYGLIWNSGPLAVASTPVFASSPDVSPVDQEPLSIIIQIKIVTNKSYFRKVKFKKQLAWHD